MIISRNVVVFALAGMGMLLAGHIPLPGIDLEQAAGQNYSNFGSAMGLQSVFMLGLQPIYTALILAEIGRLFTLPLDHRSEKRAVPVITIVRLLALAIAALQAYGVAVWIESTGLADPDFGLFVPIAITSCVAATAFALFLVSQVRLDGFPNGFWALHAVMAAPALVGNVGNTVELLRSGAISFESLLAGFACTALCVAAILFITSLWQGLAARGADNGEEGPPLPREILIWPIVLSFFVVETLLGGLAYEIAGLIPDYVRSSQSIVATIFTMLLIPVFVFGYARRSGARVGSTTRLALVASLIAVVQIGLVALSLVTYLSPSELVPAEHFHLIAFTLVAVGIGALKVPALDFKTQQGTLRSATIDP